MIVKWIRSPRSSGYSLDVVLCELFRQLLEVQHGLSDFQAIVIDAVVRILCDAHLFSKKFNTSPEFGNGFYSLVQNSFGHGLLGVEGINDGGIRSVPSSSSTFYSNVSIKREQSQTCLSYVESEKGRMKSKRKR